MESASGVGGPLAPSTTTFARTLGAFSARPEFVLVESLAAREAAHAAVLRHVRQQLVDVQPFGVVHRAGMVLRGDDLRASFMEQAGGGTAHVAEALHDHARLRDVNVQVASGFARHDEHAAAGRFDTAQAAAQRDRLARDHTGGGRAFVHGIGAGMALDGPTITPISLV
ncbi:hypothetical protein G6F50_015711 [Rhizopus delemar]|uniref:Uncharacterized protein n=1 Tax=Rhizopus delemar TaxID=936053 RepID=A0A9P6XWV7_9FUNG|nr:hypothetical protein G6F50_015711 [Rhizopus delemar]